MLINITNFILDFVLIAGFESLLTLLMVLGFNWKSLAKGKLFLAWFLITTCIYFCPIVMFGIPIITQITMIISTAYIIHKIFDLKLKKCIIDCAVMVFIIMLLSEFLWFILMRNFININIYETLNIIQKFIFGLGARFIELTLIYLYKKRT